MKESPKRPPMDQWEKNWRADLSLIAVNWREIPQNSIYIQVSTLDKGQTQTLRGLNGNSPFSLMIKALDIDQVQNPRNVSVWGLCVCNKNTSKYHRASFLLAARPLDMTKQTSTQPIKEHLGNWANSKIFASEHWASKALQKSMPSSSPSKSDGQSQDALTRSSTATHLD